MRNLRGVFVLSILILNTVFWFLPLISFALLKLIFPSRFLKVLLTRYCSRMAKFWVSCNSKIFSIVNNTRWEIVGDDGLSDQDWYLILSNHLSWVDIIVLQTILNNKIPFLKFFIKRELFWVPILGVAWWALDMPFMQRYSKEYLEKYPNKRGEDIKATKKACEKFRSTPTSVINFVEGTRFTLKKKGRMGSPHQNLLSPRAGGIGLALSSMGAMFNKILDITIVYQDGVISFWDLLCGEFRGVFVNIRKVNIEGWMLNSDYQNNEMDRQRFQEWLHRLWQQKDIMIMEINNKYITQGHKKE
ncbi:MAG: acyltransferase [Pseudomonadota bacterium]|nr:acyltransferase [Pseudomonadota bacterium]